MSIDQRSNTSTPIEEDDDVSQLCKKCGLTINEGHAYELGDDRWHIHCFSCSKCQKLLGCNSNFLVLGNGSLVCSECSYACNNCGKKIDDLAILTGDQAYCSSCFKCRSCKNKILDLRYARTSKGLFCMACHEKLIDRKKKHDKLKKDKRKSSLRNSILVPKNDENKNYSHNSNNSDSSLDKSLPAVPPKPSSIKLNQSGFLDHHNNHNHNHHNNNSPPQSAMSEFSITRDYLNEFHKSDRERPQNKSNLSNNHQQKNSSIEEIELYNSTNDSTDRDLQMDLSLSLNSTANSTPVVSTPLVATLAPAAELHKTSNEKINTTTNQSLNPGKVPNLTLSPTRTNYHIKKPSNAAEQLTIFADDETIKKREASPYNTVNRKAIVLESQQSLDSIEFEAKIDSMTPNGYTQQNVSSPPPKARLPDFPLSPNRNIDPNSPSRGLNIQGLEYQPNEIPVTTPQRSKFFTFGSKNNDKDNEDPNTKLTRSKSILSPKFNIKHKHQRSISGSKFAFSTPPTSASFSNDTKEPLSRSATMRSFHSRGHSDSTSSHVAAAFSTPPLPRANGHSRSASETSFDNYNNYNSTYMSKMDLEAKSIKSELHNLEVTKSNLGNEISSLRNSKDLLVKDLDNINSEISSNRSILQSLRKEIYELETKQQHLLSSQNGLVRHNHSSSMNNDSGNGNGIQLSESTDKSAYSVESSTTTMPSISQSNTSLSTSSTNTTNNITSPLLDEHVSIEVADIQKAGRLKPRFWRRPKLTFNGTGVNNGNKGGIVNSQSNFSISSNLLDPNNSVDYPNNLDPNKKNGISSFISKSRSTNILDSMLTTNGAYQSGNNRSNHGRTSREYSAPLIGSTLETRSRYEGLQVPLIITKCLAAVEERGLDIEGVYRISGGNSSVEKVEKAFANLTFDNEEKQMKIIEDSISGDIHAVTSALKRYLRKLPDPVIALSCYDAYIKASSKNKDNLEKKIKDLTKVMGQLPDSNRYALYLLSKHLSLVIGQQDINRMNVRNLAVVFAPTLARDETGEREITDMQPRNDSTETLFRYHETIFQEYY